MDEPGASSDTWAARCSKIWGRRDKKRVRSAVQTQASKLEALWHCRQRPTLLRLPLIPDPHTQGMHLQPSKVCLCKHQHVGNAFWTLGAPAWLIRRLASSSMLLGAVISSNPPANQISIISLLGRVGTCSPSRSRRSQLSH
jgi:hypothetical protein